MPTATFIGNASDPLKAVDAAVREYHAALDRREHGDVAAHKAMKAIEMALGLKGVTPEPPGKVGD